MYGGRPINALDQLLLPPLAPSAPKNASQRLAARLQSFYAGIVFSPDAALDAAFLRALIEKGLPLPQRIALAKAELTPDAALLHARARLELGQNYWRRVDFDECARLLTAEPVDKLSADAKLLLAVALALRNGHENAADMMEKAPLAELGIGRVAALDTLSGQTGPLAGMAEFDAALIRQLAAPSDAPASYCPATPRPTPTSPTCATSKPPTSAAATPKRPPRPSPPPPTPNSPRLSAAPSISNFDRPRDHGATEAPAPSGVASRNNRGAAPCFDAWAGEPRPAFDVW
jgi:hypothetical protein